MRGVLGIARLRLDVGQHGFGDLAEGGRGLPGAQLRALGDGVAAFGDALAGVRGQFSGALEGDGDDGAQTHFPPATASAPHKNPAPRAVFSDEQVQAAAIGVSAGRSAGFDGAR